MFRGNWVVLFIVCASFVAQGQQAKPSITSIQSLIRAKEYDQALDAIKSALHETPKDFRLWTLEGIVLSIKGDKPDALAAFDKALAISPNIPQR